MSWIKDNQNTLLQGYEFIRQLIANKGILPTLADDVEETAEVAEETIPTIN